MSDPLALPFDVYQRYRLVADLLERARRAAGEERLRVLDVGGRTAVLRDFDRVDDVVLVDLEPREGTPRLVVGDGCRLPFADASFDAVCAFDTLEHVPPELRDAFVDECARVARRWVVVAGPYASPDVAQAEELLRALLRDKLRVRHRYLEEHRDHGLPERAAVETRLAGRGARVLAVGHGNLERWVALLSLSMVLDDDPALRGLAGDFYRFYNERLYASDHAEPVYRHAVVAALGDAPLPDLDGLLDAPRAPRGALAPFTELAAALAAFDREREAWRAEREGFREAVADREEDLRGHRESLEAARRELAARDARVAELGERSEKALARVEELRHRAEARRQEAEDLRRRFEAEHAEVGVRDAELARLASALGEARAEAERLRHEAAAARELVADREAALAAEVREVGTRDREVARLAGELEAARAEAEALRHRAAAAAELEADARLRFERELEQVGLRDAELERLGSELRAALAEVEALRHEAAARTAEAEARGHHVAAAEALAEDWRRRFEQELEQVRVRDAEVARLGSELEAARGEAHAAGARAAESEREAQALRERAEGAEREAERAARELGGRVLELEREARDAAARAAAALEEERRRAAAELAEREQVRLRLQARVEKLEARLGEREKELSRPPLALLRRLLWLIYGRPSGR